MVGLTFFTISTRFVICSKFLAKASCTVVKPLALSWKYVKWRFQWMYNMVMNKTITKEVGCQKCNTNIYMLRLCCWMSIFFSDNLRSHTFVSNPSISTIQMQSLASSTDKSSSSSAITNNLAMPIAAYKASMPISQSVQISTL